MKKILLCVPLFLLFATLFANCTQQQQWNAEQRQSLRDALLTYRQMIYLENLTDAEFALFSDEVAASVEMSFPVYTSFTEMPGVSDSVDQIVVTTIVGNLNEDAHNMRNLYPYPWLVSQGILPAGLDHGQQRAFYTCFASKINTAYNSMEAFFNAILTGIGSQSQIRSLGQQCANDLFSWTVTDVEVIETVTP
ncbi:MAG: hypothetical protein RSA67_07180 [Alistipes sp.]